MTETASPPTEPDPATLFERFRVLRRDSPVSKEEDGAWQVARYSDVRQVLKQDDVFSSDVVPPEVRRDDQPPSMLFSDGEVHMGLRKLLGKAFFPRQIQLQREAIAKRCDGLVTRMIENREPCLIRELAAPLPVAVIAQMLGVEDGNLAEFKRWSDVIFSNIGELLTGGRSPAAEAAAAEMDSYFLKQIAELRRRPQPHFLSELVERRTEDGPLSDAELLSFCRLLLIAGNETTTGLIVSSVRVFHEMPEVFARLKREPQLIPMFVEETLRYYSPFQLTVRRTVRDVELAGTKIPAGELVLPLIASANRDDSAFEQAEIFRIDRDPNPHLAFGLGVHSCPGSALARLEGQIAVSTLVNRLDSISMSIGDTGQLNGFGAPPTLPVEVRAAA
ncbi:MAG: cytochrome P450 [bacterium]|nr:cytochrome P450 [bacterium]